MIDDARLASTPADGPAYLPGTVMDPDHESLARSYGEAVLNVATEQGSASAVLDELDELVELARRMPELGGLLASPSIAVAEKDRILVRMFEEQAHPVVMNSLRVLNRSGRLGLLPSIAVAARALDNERNSRRVVHVRSAVALEPAEEKALASRVGAAIGMTPILKVSVDPTILGGLVVQVGDVMLDTSVRSQLDRMRRELVEERLQSVRGQLGVSASVGA